MPSLRRSGRQMVDHEALARAVTQDRLVRFLSDTNQVVTDSSARPQWVSLGEAVRNDLAFFVRPDPEVLVLDFDTQDARTSATSLHLNLLLDGYRPVVADSGGGARETDGERSAHLFVRVSDAEERVRIAQLAKSLRADVRTGNSGIRPPMTRHRKGTARSTLLYPQDAASAVARLTSSERFPSLSPRMRELVFEEVFPKGQRSEAVLAVASAFARRGWTAEEVLLLLHSHSSAIGQTYAEAVAYRKDHDDRWFLERVWPQAQLAAAQHLEAVPVIQQLRTLARKRDWKAAGLQPSARIVYEAMLDRAERIGSLELAISRRDLNETTSLGSATTVSKALQGLKEANLITRILGEPEGPTASHDTRPHRIGRPPARYRLLLPPELEDTTSFTATQPQEGSEAFMNRAGYGQQVGLTYQEVRRCGPVSQGQLALDRRLTVRTIRRHLTRLEALGLVQQLSGQWSATTLSPEDVVPPEAEERKTAMGIRHDLEREAYHRRLQEGHK